VAGSLGLAVLAERRNPAVQTPPEADARARGGLPAPARRALANGPGNGAASEGVVGSPDTPAGRGVE